MPAELGGHRKTPQTQDLIRFAEKDVNSQYVFEKWCTPYVHRMHFRKTYSVLIAEDELASEDARPEPRRNRTSGLKFVLKTSPWRPGDLSGAKM